MDFILLDELKELTAWEWALAALCLLAFIGMILALIFLPRKEKKALSTRTLIIGAMCVSLSFVLSYIKLWSMPMGGSITLASMLPLMLFANRFGLKCGLLAGLAYGILQFIQKPEIYHWAQMLIDYPLAFTLIGLAGLTRQMQLGCVIGGLARFICHFLTGFLFFASYAPEGMNAVWYSFIYNGSYMGVDILICILLSFPVCAILDRRKIGGASNAN
ncbi:MAG: energy-coupled thiamine transporter ThiT [Clostridia bacterium]|nr:energy-coupled thiamine transporter ThiT [Clostridia bacterium]